MKRRCTGCGWIAPKGPYAQRRCKQHLRLKYHNHDAIETIHDDEALTSGASLAAKVRI